MARRYFPKDVEQLVHWYERFISPLSLIAGFVLDNLFFMRRVDAWNSTALLFFYLAVAASGIILINVIEAGKIRTTWIVKNAPLIPVIVQFSFGGLFSGYLSLYSRSASFAFSWIFVIALAVILMSNERFTRLYVRPAFQISMLFTVLFSFLIFYLPLVFLRIDSVMFLISGAVSLVTIGLFSQLLFFIVPAAIRNNRTKILTSVAVTYCVFNLLYFTNVIPPLPLALKEAGVYHNIARSSDGTYRLIGEYIPWYQSYLRYKMVYNRVPNEPVYVWTAIFAPYGFSTTIKHVWQYYDEKTDSWTIYDTVSFPITGGRDGGYRGYSVINPSNGGRWRVDVITDTGRIIGRVAFSVEETTASTALQALER